MDATALSASHGQVDLTSIPEEDARLSPCPARQANCDHHDQTSDGQQPSTFVETNPNFDGEAFGPPAIGSYCCPEPLGPPAEGMPPRYFDPMSLPPTMPYPGQLYSEPPPHFFFPPLLYPNYMPNLNLAMHNPAYAAQFCYREGIRLPEFPLHRFPPPEPIFEYRQDLILSSSFQPIWALDPSKHFGRNIFVPNQPYVYTVIESVTHYCDQPYTTAVKGKWVKGIAHLPLAHHICICLDDGYKRYEEVIRVSLLNPDIPKEFTHASEAQFLSVSHRLLKAAPNRRPTFNAALGNSLRSLLTAFSTVPVELNLTRPSDRNCQVDKEITIMVGGSTEPFESFFYPLIQNVFQPFCFRLSGTHYIVTGHYFRPLMASGTLLLTTGQKQILDTVNVHFNWQERRIFTMSTETAVAEMAYDERGNVSMSVIGACTYADYSGQYWGPHLLLVNSPKIPASCHPFMNLSLNPVLNRNFNPYQTYAFNTPPIFSSRTSCVPPPYRPGDINPLPYFYPMVTPIGMPIPGFSPMEPIHELNCIPGDGTGMSFACNLDPEADCECDCGKPAGSAPHSARSYRGSERNYEHERMECSGSVEGHDHEMQSESQGCQCSSLDADQQHDHGQELDMASSCSTLKFNPDACDFVPRGMCSSPMPPSPPPPEQPSNFCDPMLQLPPLILPTPTYSVPIQIIKIGPNYVSMTEPYPDSASDFFSDDEQGDPCELEMVQLHPAPQQAHHASSSDTSVMIAHCTDTNTFLKNMDSQSSALDAGSGSDANQDRKIKRSRDRDNRQGPSDRERSSGVEADDGVPEVSLHSSWSAEVEAHANANPTMEPEKIYRTAPPEFYPTTTYEPKRRGSGPKGFRGNRGANRGDLGWQNRKYCSPPPGNWRDVASSSNFETQNQVQVHAPSSFAPSGKPNYYQRRNSSQSYEERPRGYQQAPGNGDGQFYSNRGNRGWRGTRSYSYRPHYSQSSEYPSYEGGRRGGRNSQERMNGGYTSTDQDQDLATQAPANRPSTAPTETRMDPTSEESHGEGGPLILKETTFTNSQNSSYRNFNAANNRGRGGGGGGYRGGYRNYDSRGSGSYHRELSGQESIEGNFHDPSAYGGQRPLSQPHINKKYRKFNEYPREGEESIMDAFKDQGKGSSSPRKGGRYNYSHSPRNLIEIQTTPTPNSEEFPPLGSEPSRSRQTSPEKQTPEVTLAPHTPTPTLAPEVPQPQPQSQPSKKKQKKKMKKQKTRKDGEAVVSSDDDVTTATTRSTGSTPRVKKPLLPSPIAVIPPSEIIPGDGIHNEPKIPDLLKPTDDNPDEEADTEQDPDDKSSSTSGPSVKPGCLDRGCSASASCCGEPSD